MNKKTRKLTCIVCPRSCEITVEFEGEKPVSISGNLCKRGESYANAECTNPLRSVTTTVRCASGKIVSVKTSSPIPKSKVFDVMAELRCFTAPDGVKIGDIIIKGVAGTASDIVATSNC